MKLIVGLGNPGTEYAKTRHNVGWMVLDALAQRHTITGPRQRFHGAALEGSIAGEKVMLLEPLTYMNRSGLTVGEAVTFHKLALTDLLIVVDDVALPCGKLRLRPDGSPGGHNGLKDIERALGTPAYPRLRFGIDSPPGRVPQADYVLGRFSPDQQARVAENLPTACDAIECWIREGMTAAMNRFNV